MKIDKNTKRPIGRPDELVEGRRVNLYLDQETLDKAQQLGDGNVSKGIRIAVGRAKTKKENEENANQTGVN